MLRNKYRPKSFKTFLGNEEVVSSLQKRIGKVQTFLLHGERGCGKTTLARLIAKTLSIDKAEVYEINASNKTGVDDARQIEEFAYLLPTFGDKKMFIIDEAHRMTGNAQDSLLKILEEPPDHVVFVLCTTNPSKIAPTIRNNRAYEYHLKPLGREEISKLLRRVINKEGIEINTSVVKTIIKESKGIPRQALNYLEKVIGMSPKKAIKLLASDDEDEATVAEICKALVTGTNIKALRALVEEFNEDPEKARISIFNYLGGWADNTNKEELIQRIHFLQGAFEDPIYDNGSVGLKRQIREAFLISKNLI